MYMYMHVYTRYMCVGFNDCIEVDWNLEQGCLYIVYVLSVYTYDCDELS